MTNLKTYSSDQEREDALQALSDKLDKARKEDELGAEDNASGWAVGVRYASEFSASVIVASLLGAGIDYLAGSKPWGLMLGLVLGFMAGTRSIVRTAKELSVQDGANRPDGKGAKNG